MLGWGVVDEDEWVGGGGRVDAGEVVGVERMDLVLGFGGWPVWIMRLVGRATVRLVVVVIFGSWFSWHQYYQVYMGTLNGYRGRRSYFLVDSNCSEV